MSITDELRRWVGIYEHEVDYMLTSRQATQLLEIADRIDEQHRRALEKVSAMVDAPPKLDELDRAVAILEQHDIGSALRISELFVRVEAIERKLNHRGDR